MAATARFPSCLLLLSLSAAVAGCINTIELFDDDGTSGDPEPADATTLPLPPPATSTTADPEPGSSTTVDPDPEPTAGSSTGPGGLGEGEHCDLERQECAPGLKCMPYSTDGASLWNDSACFPIVPDPADLGEPCQWFGEPWSGYDDCGFAQVCWQVYEDQPGECKGLCLFSDPEDWDSSYCEDAAATPNFGCETCFCVCEVPCDPLGQICGDGLECQPDGDLFLCVPDASGELGAYGDPCEYVNVCDPGLACLNVDAVPGCMGDAGCCSPYCDVTQPNTCPGAAEGQECTPWYQSGEAPPGFENVGVCAVPL